jgi:hypothetical protein
MASIKSIEKILGSPVLHLQVRQRVLGVIVTDQIYTAPALNAVVRPKSQEKRGEIRKNPSIRKLKFEI